MKYKIEKLKYIKNKFYDDKSNLFTGVITQYNGEFHIVEGLFHNENGPAIINNNSKQYFINGIRHRLDGPAIYETFEDKTISFWYKDGKKHRDNDFPAIEHFNKDKSWFKIEYLIDGKHHRDGGPALIYNDYKKWFNKGRLHRLDGPAIEYKNGDFEFWKNGKKHRLNDAAISKDNKLEWYNYGVLHNENGPAVKYTKVISSKYYCSNQYWYKGNYLYKIKSDEELTYFIRKRKIIAFE